MLNSFATKMVSQPSAVSQGTLKSMLTLSTLLSFKIKLVDK